MAHNRILFGCVVVITLILGFYIRGYYDSYTSIAEKQTQAGTLDSHVHEQHKEKISEDHGTPEEECHECAFEPKTLEELKKLKCEHSIPIIDCKECRYEVGVVKVHPSVMKEPGNKEGLIEVTTAKIEWPIRVINSVGEISMNMNKVVRLKPRIEGIVSKVKIDLGQVVRTGDTLFELDSQELREAQLNYIKGNSLLELAEKELKRETSMYEKRISSEQEMLDARAKYEEARIERDVSEKKLIVLGLTEEQIRRLSFKEVSQGFIPLPMRSPISGVIIEKHVTLGEVVNPDTVLTIIADLSTLWIWVDIYEREFQHVLQMSKKGKVEAEISVSAYPEKTFTGEMDYLSDIVAEDTRTIKARISLSNPSRLLRPGMFANCKLKVPSDQPRLMVPKVSMLKDEDNAFVFKQIADDLFVRQDIKIGGEYSNHMEVLKGLSKGDRVVSEGSFVLKSDILREKMGAGCAD